MHFFAVPSYLDPQAPLEAIGLSVGDAMNLRLRPKERLFKN
jgi:hypothetical protein